ncbi:MAG: hypothetical protein AAF467_09925 [Actinomycetota bacterium]
MIESIPSVVTVSDPLLRRNALLFGRLYGYRSRNAHLGPALPEGAQRFLTANLRLEIRPSRLGGGRPSPGRVTPIVKLANCPAVLSSRPAGFAEVVFLSRDPRAVARSKTAHWNMPDDLDDTLDAMGAEASNWTYNHQRRDDPLFRHLVASCILSELHLRHARDGNAPVVQYERLTSGDLDSLGFLSRIDGDWRCYITRSYHRKSRTTGQPSPEPPNWFETEFEAITAAFELDMVRSLYGTQGDRA